MHKVVSPKKGGWYEPTGRSTEEKYGFKPVPPTPLVLPAAAKRQGTAQLGCVLQEHLGLVLKTT